MATRYTRKNEITRVRQTGQFSIRLKHCEHRQACLQGSKA